MKQRRCIATLLAAVLVALWSWSALIICNKCGHEAAENETQCSHCNAVLVQPAQQDGAKPDKTFQMADHKEDSSISSLALTAIKEDVNVARDPKTRPELALAFYKNALALLRLVSTEKIPADSGKRLLEEMNNCREAISRIARPCNVCGGTGMRTVKMQSLTGEDRNSAGGVLCETCGGSGMLRSSRTADELRIALAQGYTEFETNAKALGRVAVGRAWVPKDLLPLLDLNMQVLLRNGAAAPCKSCYGIGRQTCTACRGVGKVKCRQSGCQNGMVLVKQTNVLSAKTALQQRVPCPACKGSGWIACEVCRASGSVPCAACQGSGQPPRCNRCGGEGLIVCTRCNGSGINGKIPCQTCGQLGKSICPTCHGEGHMGR